MTGLPTMATVLFTDLVGSTALRVALGEERADELRRVHDQLLGERVLAQAGRVVKGGGDGLLAAFTSASAALTAAVETLEEGRAPVCAHGSPAPQIRKSR